MRIFIDTNILISAALFPNSIPAQAFMIAVSEEHDAVVCEQNIEELNRIFRRKFPHKLDVLEQFWARAILALEIVPVPKSPVSNNENVIRDVKDRPILRAALAARVDLLITGDKDFLEAALAIPKVLSPAEFVQGVILDC